MGTLTLTVKRTDSDAIAYAVSIEDADINRLAVAYGAQYFPEGVTEGETVRLPTATEIVTAIATGLVNGMMTNVVSYERAKAAEQAAAAVVAPTITPI